MADREDLWKTTTNVLRTSLKPLDIQQKQTNYTDKRLCHLVLKGIKQTNM